MPVIPDDKILLHERNPARTGAATRPARPSFTLTKTSLPFPQAAFQTVTGSTMSRKPTGNPANGASEQDIALFTRQLATMLKAGLPMLRALDVMARGLNGAVPASRLLADIRRNVESGRPLSSALEKYPRQFDRLYLHLVRAGEHTGALDAILERLALHKERMLALKRRIKSAFYYPAFVAVVALIAIAVVLAFQPAINGPAPDNLHFIARAVRHALLFFSHYWPLILATPALGAWWLFTIWKTSENFRNRADRWLLNSPIFGKLTRYSAVARWSRVLSTLYAAGVPLIEGMGLLHGATGNHVYDEASLRIQTALEQGDTLAEATVATRLFPDMAVQMIITGETTGALDASLARLADHYETEVTNAAAALASLLTPLITVVMGIVIGILVIGSHLLNFANIP
jgi:type IV pilus assembly protein PilC